MIDNAEFSIHKFETNIFEMIYDIQFNKVLHTNKEGDLIITYLKYSVNTSEIKVLKSFKTQFNKDEITIAKFFNIENYSNSIVKEHSEILLLEKENNYVIYEVYLKEKKNEILFELAKKNLNKVHGYNKIFLVSQNLFFLFFEVNYNFMIYESNSKCMEISDKKIILYTVSYYENSVFLSILYESNLLEIYQFNSEVTNTPNLSKFKKILELVKNLFLILEFDVKEKYKMRQTS